MLQTNYLREKFELIDQQGWAVLDLPYEFCLKLLAAAQNRFQNHEFTSAAITQNSVESQKNLDIRSDWTRWLPESSTDVTEQTVLDFLKKIQLELSQFFRFGLTHFECHYALYQTGQFYKRHSDQTKNNNHRFFSFVIYLNENWLPEYGGQLIGYNQQKRIFEIQPNMGKMILFKSDLEHEVAAAFKPRWSLTGWFRK